MTTVLIFNIALSVVVFAAVVGPIAWSIVTREPATAPVRNDRHARARSAQHVYRSAPTRA
ncbi:MAG: hypothetical protein WBP81_08085 [Solirubrobacteraceae bacterium]